MVRFVPRPMSTLWNDLRYAGRLLIKTPAFTIVAVATLALGIGANTAIFSVVSAALINPLPYPDSDRLVVVSTMVQRETLERRAFSMPDYRDLRDRSQSFDGIAAWSADTLTLVGARRAGAPDPGRDRVGGLLRAPRRDARHGPRLHEDRRRGTRRPRPRRRLARVLAARDGRPLVGARRDDDAERSAVHDHRRAAVRASGASTMTPTSGSRWACWASRSRRASSTSADPAGAMSSRASRRGVSAEQANADVAAVFRQLEQAYPDTNAKYTGAVFSLKEETVGSLRPLLLTMLAAVAFVLLIACVNLANLMLARASTRQRETAIRAALGADRRRLARQFVVEGTLLSVVGAAAGLLLAVWLVDGIAALAPAGLPSFVTPRLDWRVLAFLVAVTGASGLLLGLLPAWQGSRADLNEVLKDSARGTSGGAARARTRSALVVAEVALSLVLLIGAGLMVRSFLNLQRIDVGFRADQALIIRVSIPQKVAADQLPQVTADLRARIAAVPGVRQASIGTDAPFSGGSSATIVVPEGADPGVPSAGIRIYRHSVTPGFFATLGARARERARLRRPRCHGRAVGGDRQPPVRREGMAGRGSDGPALHPWPRPRRAA